nr:hypothetical protein [Cellvibrionaceae bacterium]
MNSLLSRADLLRVLKQSEDDTSCHDGLASALAYKKHGESPTEKNATNQNNLDTEPATNTSSKTNTFATEDIYLPQREQRYWYVARCEAKPKQEQQKIEWPETTEQDSRPVQPLPKQPLRKPGQWQNLWDQVLTGRRRSKRIDVAASLRLLSRNEPLQELPRQERASFNRPVVLLLEWSETLYPI